jgi:hypothetical protein
VAGKKFPTVHGGRGVNALKNWQAAFPAGKSGEASTSTTVQIGDFGIVLTELDLLKVSPSVVPCRDPQYLSCVATEPAALFSKAIK